MAPRVNKLRQCDCRIKMQKNLKSGVTSPFDQDGVVSLIPFPYNVIIHN